DDALVRHVVAADLHAVHDRGLAFRDYPAQIHDRFAVGPGAPQDIGAGLDVDVAVVVVERLQLAGRVVPLLLIEIDVRALATDAEEARPLRLPERIEGLQLLAREAAAAHD